MAGPRLVVQAAPFLRRGVTTPGLMADVLVALLPVVGVAVWHFGLSALLVIAAAAAGAALADGAAGHWASLGDGSAAVTGVLLGLTLPPGIPLWMAALGGAVAIGLGKRIWGGLGHNLFNPALVGRAFLQAAFPTAVTTWAAPAGPWTLRASNLALPFLKPAVDGMSAATPLNLMKFSQQGTPLAGLLSGDVPGSLGETSGAVLLLAGAYLIARRACDWRIPASILATVAALAALLHLADPARYPGPLFALFSGGLLLGAFFMATDPVTSPLAPRGAWLFGAGIGTLVVVIRNWGGLPEGVMYAILLMNAASPLVERVTQPRPFGGRRAAT